MATAFRKILIGRESTYGTAVAATNILYGNLSVTPEMQIHMPQDERGSLAANHRSVGTGHSASLRFSSDATFEQILHLLSMTLKTEAKSGSSAEKIYTFTPSLTSANDQKHYTFEYGDNEEQFESASVVCQSLEISVQAGGPLSVSANMIGHFPITTSFTSLAVPTEDKNHTIISDSGVFTLDSAWGNLGNTPQDATNEALFLGGSIRLNSGLTAQRNMTLDTYPGVQTAIYNPTRLSQSRRSHSIDMDLVFTSGTASSVWAAYRDQTNKAVRLKWMDVTNSIETNKRRALTVDMHGRFTNVSELLSDSNGDSVLRVTFTSFEDTSGNELSVVVNTKTADVGAAGDGML